MIHLMQVKVIIIPNKLIVTNNNNFFTLDEENLNNDVLESFDFDETITARKTTFITPIKSTLQAPNFSIPCSSQLKISYNQY